MKILEKPRFHSYRYGRFFTQLQQMTNTNKEHLMMENANFVPSYKIPENNQAKIPTFYINKAEIKPYREQSSSAFINQNTKDEKFLKTLYINKYPSSSFKSHSSSSFFPSSNASPTNDFSSLKKQILGHKPNHPTLQHSRKKMNFTRSELFPSISNNVNSYERPLANVIQRKPADSYSDSYGNPVGEIITNNIPGVVLGVPRPLSTTSLSLNNLNNQDSYGQPLSPVIAGEPGPQPQPSSVLVESVQNSTDLAQVTTEAPEGETNKTQFTDEVTVFPDLQEDVSVEGIHCFYY